MKDRHAVVWTRLSGVPIKMGELYTTELESRFVYDDAFLSMNLPGLGIILSPEFFSHSTIKWTRTERFDFPPPLQSLIPPADEHNFQRHLIMNYLETSGIKRGNAFDNDWNILTLSGHGGIGHLDTFSSDEKAITWYSSPALPQIAALGKESTLGFSLKNMLTWFDDESGHLLEFMGPTPSVGGAIPKLLLSIPKAGWNGMVGLPTRFGNTQFTDIILKLEKDTAYPGISELEALGLDLHKKAGFETPRYWLSQFNGIHAIAIERFDRDQRCIPVFQESLFSILASGNKGLQNHYDATYDQIGRMFDNPRVTIIADRKAAKQHLLKRLLLSFLSGNGDLHLENLSIQIREGISDFSPVYDPVPMRAYRIHNLLSVMPFGDYGDVVDIVDGHEQAINFTSAVKRLNQALGFDQDSLVKLIAELLAITEDFSARVTALERLPAENKTNLIQIHTQIRNQLAEI
ncbi:HipA domain-containing protein [sulfur-oxidizing endosymbiont of Gigantopelta aegis]|uniref:HipA domain-containing protein n=1 Tax=sulfur-oxidizing endosymbiont of Gigantopelta aegis TaxID=2794934 RepID=UPI0018DB8FB1|nr:HipA domain-containing protein [sulfur-oxidizing endosymbiont of Gigantopelta aegis]